MNLANAGVNDQAVELLEPSVEHRVLGVGFGGGVALSKLAQRAGFVAGIDPSEPALRAARKRFHDEIEAGRVQLTQAPVDAIPFKDGSFDRVLTVQLDLLLAAARPRAAGDLSAIETRGAAGPRHGDDAGTKLVCTARLHSLHRRRTG